MKVHTTLIDVGVSVMTTFAKMMFHFTSDEGRIPDAFWFNVFRSYINLYSALQL